MKNLILPLILLAITFTACQSEEEKRAKQAEQEAREAAEGLTGGLRQLEEVAKQLQSGDGQVKEPVNFRELKELLPSSIAGMDQQNAEGQTSGAMGFSISQAEADYQSGDKNIRLSIMDAGGVSGALMGLAAWSVATVDRETTDGYERTSTLKGHKSYERYTKSSQDGQVSVIVGSRFVVNAEGSGVSMNELKQAVEKVNLNKLEKLQ
jgi:hypothetical protein